MAAPSLAWVAELAALVSADDASVAGLARWAGADAPAPGDDQIVVEHPAAIAGARDAVIAGDGGRPEAVGVAYDPGAGPELGAATAALGAWHEFARPPAGPFQGAFDGAAPRGWELVGTLLDPPGAPGRRLVEVALVRS